MSDPYPYDHAPAPSRHPTAPNALRRPHAGQPPSLLTATFDNLHNSSLGAASLVQTPLSSTSLSSPFSAYPVSAYPHASAEIMRGQTTRPQPSAFSGGYNPQQWAPMRGALPQTANNVRRQRLNQPTGPDEPMASPPPPYSPRTESNSQEFPQNLTNLTSPADSVSTNADSSHQGTPISATAAMSPELLSPRSGEPSGRQRLQLSQSSSPNDATAPVFPPPPPLTGGKHARNRTNSRVQGLGILSSLRPRLSINDVPPESPLDTIPVAPGARRAASTGAIGMGGSSARSSAYSESPTTWQQGMELPPPPPGPPPSAARAQSLNRYPESSSTKPVPKFSARHRPPPNRGTALGSVPPTPADWQEESLTTSSGPSRVKGPSSLHIDTAVTPQQRRPHATEPTTVTGATPTHTRTGSGMAGLFRAPAIRNRSAKGIRERRSESRNGKGRMTEDDELDLSQEEDSYQAPKPADLTLTSQVSRVMHSATTSPRNRDRAASLRSIAPADVVGPHSGKRLQQASPHATSQPTSAPSSADLVGMDTMESILAESGKQNGGKEQGSVATRSPRKTERPGRIQIPGKSQTRPISHILHMPVSNEGVQIPLTPSSTTQDRPVSDLLGPESPQAFAVRANERHRNFAAREASARNDSERLEMFIQYVLAESRIRREQYSSVFEEEEVAVAELMQDLFRPMQVQREIPEAPRQDQDPAPGDSRRTSLGEESSSQAESYATSQKHPSPSSATSSGSIRPTSGVMKDFVPCLSPIASMSITTGHEEAESRGRAPSRWWEGSGSIGSEAPSDAFNVMRRTKRESKYMGVSKELLDSPAFLDARTSTPTNISQSQAGQSSSHRSYGPGEYPPEKVGWHEDNIEEQTLTGPIPRANPQTPASAPYTPRARGLDISRLVTLPPPYPRHHPAVNNSHPELDGVRAVVRQLQEKTEPQAVRDSYVAQIQAKRQRATSWQKHQASLHQQDMHYRMQNGDLSPSEYEETEVSFREKMFNSEKEVTQAEFDLFQDLVVTPLHKIYTDRVELARNHMDKLSARIASDAHSHSPNLPQEEGDERPELLEIMTMLKWLYDGKEACERQLFDLLSERNEKYKSVVVLPYTQQQLQSKVNDALSFFAQDLADRKNSFDGNAYHRAQKFLQIIDSNISRGVEMLLDAFWSIAPQLTELLSRIPSSESSENFEVHVPMDELEENPSYNDHPLQYMYSLLGHAEKSSYQFIESQVNLFCLLHEIRNAVLVTKLRSERSEHEATIMAKNQDERTVHDQRRRLDEWQHGRQSQEETKLTADLKDKVGLVEGQWKDALGEEIMAVRERVRGWLLEEDGWDDDQDAEV